MAGKTAWSLAAAVGAQPEPVRPDSRHARSVILAGGESWESQDRLLRPDAVPEQAGVADLMSARARALEG